MLFSHGLAGYPVGMADSALNLRLVLASFGLVICAVFAVLLFRVDQPVLGAILAALAVTAVVDVVIVVRRRRERQRMNPGRHYSLFE